MPHNFLHILEKLISFKSITPKSSGAVEYIESILSKANFKCDIKCFSKGKDKVTNLYAIYGDKSPHICFAGHVDVVPPMNEKLWHYDPFVMTIDNDKIYGRGTVDMKGAISVSLAAALNLIDKEPNFDGAISFLITSDEEGDAHNGTKEMLKYTQNKSPQIDLCILGEPTSKMFIGDTIKIGRRGSINFTLKVVGKQGHVAYPEKAINSIPIMLKIINELCNTTLDNGSEFFEPSSLQITSIDTGNHISNIIPEFLTARFNIRFNDKHTSQSLVNKVTELISKYTENYELVYNCNAESFIQSLSKKMKIFADIIKQQSGISPVFETGGGTSDARFIHHYTKVIEFGLKSELAHKINEYTQISDLQTLYNVYYNSLDKFLNS